MLLFGIDPQLEFFAAGNSGVHQRLIYGGNQTGKSEAAAFEVAVHATGEYPEWWTGKRFDKPLRIWVVGESDDARARHAAAQALRRR